MMSTVRFKTRQLELVIAIAETRSLRQAAERIHISQPAATRLLHELESAMGLVLFERSRQGMQPTAAGLVMVEHARVLLAAMRDAWTDTREASTGKIGSLRLGVFGAADPECIAVGVLGLKRQYPKVKVAIKEAPLEMLLAALRDGELDLIVSRVLTTDPGEAVALEVLYNETFVIACGVRSSLSRKRSVAANALFEKTWIIPPSDTLARQHVDAYFASAYGKSPPGIIESASLLANLSLLNRSDSVVVVASQLADFLVRQGLLRRLPVKMNRFSRPVALITSRVQVVKPQLEYMMQLMREYVRQAASTVPDA
jgi:DNA-binding transcriptional LysR family regulator